MSAVTLPLPQVLPHPGMYLRLDFSHDGRLLAAASSGKPNHDQSEGLVWDTADGAVRCRWEDPYLCGLSFAPTGYGLAVSSRRNLQLWNAETGQLVRKLAARPEFVPFSDDCSSYTELAFSPSGRQMAVGVEDGGTGADAVLADVETGDVVHRLKKGRDGRAVVDVRFVRNGAWLSGLGYTYDELDRLYVWDARSGVHLGNFRGPRNCSEVTMAASGELVASYSPGAREPLLLWRPDLFTKSRRLNWERVAACEGAPEVTGLRFAPDGRMLAAVGYGTVSPDGPPPPQSVRLWDTGTGKLRAVLPEQVHYFCLDFSPDGSLLATMSQDTGGYFNSDAPYYVLTLWDTLSGAVRATARTESRKTNLLYHHPERLRFSPDGRYLAVSHLKHVELWSLAIRA